MQYVGVDLHKTRFTVYFRKSGRWREYGANTIGIESFIRDITRSGEIWKTCVGVESTGNTRYFKKQLEAHGITVRVINTNKFKVITESEKKTDKYDAATIAEFLEKDMLPEAKICSEETEMLRQMLKIRRDLVRFTVRLKNQIHGILTSNGMEDRRATLQSKKGRKKILDALSETEAGLVVHQMVELIDQLSEKVKNIEAHLEEKMKDDAEVKLLQTIPGCGKITAWTIKAYTDDIRRFRDSKHYAAHAGLVPWVQNSNETIRHGKITKRGPEQLRTVFVQLVMGMNRLSKTGHYRIMAQYRTMKTHKGSGKAIVATARKLSKIVWHMLTYNEPFNPDLMANSNLSAIAERMRKSSIQTA